MFVPWSSDIYQHYRHNVAHERLSRARLSRDPGQLSLFQLNVTEEQFVRGNAFGPDDICKGFFDEWSLRTRVFR